MPQRKKPSPPSRPAMPSRPAEGTASFANSTPGERPTVARFGAPRLVSLAVLVAVVVLVAIFFFRVMAGFFVPLFLAAVLAVVFRPMHQWFVEAFGERMRLAALASTGVVALGVLLPSTYLGWKAFTETKHVVELLSDKEQQEAIALRVSAGAAKLETWIRDNVSSDFELKKAITELRAALNTYLGKAVELGLVSLKALVIAIVGLVIMVFALYFFFADGPSILESLMRLSPLDDQYESELLGHFASVSRAMVLATVLSAIVQGLLAGIGYYFALDPGAPIFLLTVLTTLLAIVPFVGATAVWIPVALWIFFVQPDGWWPSIGLAIYGAGIVSSIDNFIKPFILHGQSNLHPLLALLSVVGGVTTFGPVGILVGPMLVAFLQALLGMLRKELDHLHDAEHAAQLEAS